MSRGTHERVTVRDYQSGATLPGAATRALVAASKAERSGTGAVLAYYHRGWWHPLDDSRKSDCKRMGYETRSVWTE